MSNRTIVLGIVFVIVIFGLIARNVLNTMDSFHSARKEMRAEYNNKNFTKIPELMLKVDSMYEAKSFINTLIKGSGIHHEYYNEKLTLMGLMALREGNATLAYEYLIESTNVKSTPVLSSFGPDLSLFMEFLKRGDKDIALEYLNLADDFWEYYAKDIEQWKIDIKNGVDPNIDGKIYYRN